MRPKKIKKTWKLRPILIQRIQAVKELYDLTETEVAERALEFGIISLAKFLAKNQKATDDATIGGGGQMSGVQENNSQSEAELQRLVQIARTPWVDR